MKQPIVITTAITGSQPRKKDNPAVPVTPSEQIESTHEAFEAGSSLVHIHVRDKDENSSSDPELFGQVQEGVRAPSVEQLPSQGSGHSARDDSSTTIGDRISGRRTTPPTTSTSGSR